MRPNQDDNPFKHLRWTLPDDVFSRAQVDDCIKRTNWKVICEKASHANNGQPCQALPEQTCGGSNLARLLEFQDGTYWIAKGIIILLICCSRRFFFPEAPQMLLPFFCRSIDDFLLNAQITSL